MPLQGTLFDASCRAVHGIVIPGRRIIDGFQVSQDRRILQFSAQVRLEAFNQLVPPCDSPSAGDHHMERHELASSRPAGAQGMVFHSVLFVRL
ncbi:MAG TPA: hypothetical protein VFD74_06350 [Thermoleophilia bacterium]|nr:hypothetical protein [Thermoleophilia bacterium]